jgi:hypothetical protein
MTRSMHDLRARFRSLDLRVKNSLADEESPLRLALTALTLAHDEAQVEYLSLDELHEALEAADVSVKRSSLAKGLGRAGNRVTRREVSGETQYRVATKGRRVAEEVLAAGALEFLYVEGNRPRTARRELAEVMGGLNGIVRICDPYYGVRSLDSLELIPNRCLVRFLTGKTNEGATKLAGPLKDFKRERPNVELRVAARPQELHDRFVLSHEKILLVGHGLKDIGAKESFVVALPRSFAPDLLDNVECSFDQKWANGSPL